MIDIGSSTGHKIGILLVLTTLAIGSAAALEWENVNDGDTLPEDYTFNVTHDSDINVNFSYSNGGEWVSSVSNSPTGDDGSIFWWEDSFVSGEGLGTADITIKAEEENNNQTTTNEFDITIDDDSPSFSLTNPSSFASSTQPDIEVSAEDSTSNVQNVTVYLKDSNGNVVNSKTCDTNSQSVSCTLDPGEDLDDGETYDVNASAYDLVGNEGTETGMSFTVDSSYDGDSSPSLDIEGEDGGIVLFDDDVDVDVTFDDTDSVSDTDVTCNVGGETISAGTLGSDLSDETVTCNIDHDDDQDYFDSEVEVYVEMEDEAGNTEESSSETVSFDVNPPSVSGLSIPTSADLYNSNFDVEFAAYDSASDVEEAEYYFDSDTDYGDGTEFDYSSDTDSYEIDTSELSDGDHTLYVRARDEADRWGSAETVDFSFDPDAVPEISLDVPQNVSITAGEQGSFDVDIENTGDLFISSIELTGSAEGVFSNSETISDLEPGESITAPMEIDTESNNIGEHTVEISTDNPSMTKEINLVVEANSDQQDEIDSELSDYQSRLQKMESNVTTLRQKVSDDKKQKLDSNFSSFKQKVEDAQTAVDNGDYYEAEAVLEGIDQDYSAAESTYETVHKEYQNNQFWMLIFLSIGGLVVLLVGAIGALTYTDEVDFDIRDYLENLQELEFDTGSLGKYPDKVKRLMEGKDTSDAEDFEWEGFNNN